MSVLVGCRFGEYQILRHLGRGGMADVYAARHLSLHRNVAMKVLRSDVKHTDDEINRFRREAQAAARLNHPAIVQVYDIGESEGNHFITQELVEGCNLREHLQRNGPLDAEDAVEVLHRVSEALHVAHTAGVTHRDIKPENIMRADDGVIKVTDFGLARVLTTVESSTADLTRDGITLGTPRYMSPEQIQGHAVDGRSDLYSLGVTLYHLIAGRPPFDDTEALALAVKHLHETPEPIDRARGSDDIPAWMVAVVSRLLRKAPEERFASAADVLAVVEHQRRLLSDTDDTPAGDPSLDSTQVQVGGNRATVVPETAMMDGARFSGSQTTVLGTATVQLQRVTEASHIATRRRRVRVFACGILALACLFGGIGMSRRTAPTSLSERLNQTRVAQEPSIEDQYLRAMDLASASGWKAVLDYYGDDGSDYVWKASIQLARLLVSQRRNDEAQRVLDRMYREPTVPRLYRALGLAIQHEIAENRGRERESENARSQLLALIESMQQSSASDVRLLERVLPDTQKRRLRVFEYSPAAS
ncbi:MAG: serine/threonine-protein kinase [Planctomycetota bacterium]